MKKSNIIIILIFVCFQSFGQNTSKQSFGFLTGLSSSYSYLNNYMDLDGEGIYFIANYKHNLFNDRMRISPFLQAGNYWRNDPAKDQTKYITTSINLTLEYDVFRYKAFNVLLQGGCSLNSGFGYMLNTPINYTCYSNVFGLGFRYEPINSPISITWQPLFVEEGINKNIIFESVQTLIGVDIKIQ